MPKVSLAGASTEDLLREAAGRKDLPDAVTRLGGKALLFEAAKPEWHVGHSSAGYGHSCRDRPRAAGFSRRFEVGLTRSLGYLRAC